MPSHINIGYDDRFADILKDPSRQVRRTTVAGLVQNDCFLGQSEGQYCWGEAAGGFLEAIAKSMAVPKEDRILQAHACGLMYLSSGRSLDEASTVPKYFTETYCSLRRRVASDTLECLTVTPTVHQTGNASEHLMFAHVTLERPTVTPTAH